MLMMSCRVRCQRAEQQLLTLRDIEDDDQDDFELTASSSHSINSSSRNSQFFNKKGGEAQGLRKRGGGEHKVMEDLEKMGVRAGPNVAKAVDIIDTWTLVTGRWWVRNRFIDHPPMNYFANE